MIYTDDTVSTYMSTFNYLFVFIIANHTCSMAVCLANDLTLEQFFALEFLGRGSFCLT